MFGAVRAVNESITMFVMKRLLVLTHEQARHPFRRSLPAHVFAVVENEAGPQPEPAKSDDEDWKLFLLSFVAFFTVAYSFIA